MSPLASSYGGKYTLSTNVVKADIRIGTDLQVSEVKGGESDDKIKSNKYCKLCTKLQIG